VKKLEFTSFLVVLKAESVTQVSIIVGTKGRGSNMVALARHISADPGFHVHRVIGTKADAPAILAAQELGLKTTIVEYGENFESGLLTALEETDWICLAGFLRLLPESIVNKWDHKILNIHPALLPKYGGKGMYGIHVHEAVIAAGETESGCSVHFVTKEYDEGAVIRQERCPVLPEDTAEDLAARVLVLEHRTYFAALKEVAHRSRY
jgi:formyltetrahydrofolate-dependent phosphoribosylglycinamide formyltransferase